MGTEALSQEQNEAMIYDNPMQTDGFEFVEYASDKPEELDRIFKSLGFTPIAKHRSKNVTLYRQGETNFILNAEPNSHASYYVRAHGPSAVAMAFRVKDAKAAHKRALSLGAKDAAAVLGAGELQIPAILGIGNSLLYFVDKYEKETIYDTDFVPFPGVDQHPKGFGLILIDHLTHNVYQGRMDLWYDFYHRLFNFREQRYFDIKGERTGLLSRALISPCGKIRIPINESQDSISQIAEYLNEYKGEGIQHVALLTDDITTSVDQIRSAGIPFTTVPNSYYNVIEERLPNHGLDIEKLKNHNILIDGEVDGTKKDLLLQIFSKTVVGPIFFEFIQRLGHQGFGEGNFGALFEAMERDQIERGVI